MTSVERSYGTRLYPRLAVLALGLFVVATNAFVIAGLLLMFHPFSGALSLTLLVAVWLAVRGIMEIAHGIGDARGRAFEIVLGVVNILFAIWIVATVPFSALTLPGYFLAVAFLFGGGTEIAAALRHRQGAPAFAR